MWLYVTFDSMKGAPRVRVAEWFALIVLFVVTAVIIAESLIDEPLRRRTDGPRQRYGEIVSGW
jgi:hypothetical protein